MKTIRIKSLKLTNFKGIRALHLNDLTLETYIYGANGIGKTTIFDAFSWLLFGKDSTDRKDFEIKTLNSRNQVIPKIDHEVEAVIEVNGETITLRRILKEKWVKRRGTTEAEFSGNETNYEWNGVPYNAGDYMLKISNIVNEKVFKMITNPSAFNSLKWQEQRDVLIAMTGDISDSDVATGDSEFESLLAKLENKTLDEYKRQIKSSISKSKKELQAIPTRIDEVERAKPEALDFDKLRIELKKAEEDLNAVNEQITDELKAQQAIIDQKSEIKTQIQKLDFQISDIKHEYRGMARDQFRNQNSGNQDLKRQILEKETEIRSAEISLEKLDNNFNTSTNEVNTITNQMMELRTKWEQKNAEPINLEIDTCCPTCKQELPEGDVEKKKAELNERYKIAKQNELDSINSKGKGLKNTLAVISKEKNDIQLSINRVESQHSNLIKELEALKAKVTNENTEIVSEETIYQNLLTADTKIQPIKNQVQELANKMDSLDNVDVSALRDKHETLRTDVQFLEIKLSKEQDIQLHNKRIEELSAEEKTLAQAIADQEKDLFTIEAFEKEKSTRIEETVNQRFRMVNFKLFETQINGGEVPTCKALINGVPFSDANTASKINAGLDIINTLCLHYKANAPIFIDNRESVVELIPTESQLINLIVSDEDKKLRVSDRPMSYSQHIFKDKLETA